MKRNEKLRGWVYEPELSTPAWHLWSCARCGHSHSLPAGKPPNFDCDMCVYARVIAVYNCL